MGDRAYVLDVNAMLADTTASNPYVPTLLGMQTTVGGNAATMDLIGGGVVSSTYTRLVTGETARFDGALIVQLAQITATGNYRLTVQCCNPDTNGAMWTPAFTQNCGSLDFGATAGRDGLAMTTPQPSGPFISTNFGSGLSFAEQYELLFTNDQNNVKYQYLRLWLTLLSAAPASSTVGNVTPSTASPSIAFQAYVCPLTGT